MTVVEALNIVTPVATFVLGLVVQRRIDQASDRRILSHELLELTQEWYEQIRLVGESESSSRDQREIRRRHAEYVTSRAVAPRFISVIERLKKYRGLAKLRQEAEMILSELTYRCPGSKKNEYSVLCEPLSAWYSDQDSSQYLAGSNFMPIDELLKSLDRRMQKTASLSGKLG
jgi:hypothetical protein